MALTANFGGCKDFCYLLDQWGKLWEYYDYRNEKLLKASLTVTIIMARMPPAVFTVGVGTLNVFSRQLIYSIAPNAMYHAIT